MKMTIIDAEALERLENLDPATATMRECSAIADIRAAMQMRDVAQNIVDSVVAAARATGVTWVEIGIALNVSPKALDSTTTASETGVATL